MSDVTLPDVTVADLGDHDATTDHHTGWRHCLPRFHAAATI